MNQCYLKFVGEYKQLQSMGYTFQKLFAGNYMSWRKDDLIIWKRGAELCIDNHDSCALVKFFHTNPYCTRNQQSIFFYKVYKDDSYTDFKYMGSSTKELTKLRKMRDNDKDHLIVTEYITVKTMDALKELAELKWFKEAEHFTGYDE